MEQLDARSGHSVFRLEGRLMASAVDPIQEAKAWVDRRCAFIKKVRAVVVLGLGAGYHVRELCARTEADVLVIEHNREIFERAGEFATLDRDRVRLEHIETVADLRAHASVQELVRHSFVVFGHAPSVALSPDVYRACRALLTGREWGALRWQWQLRGLAPLESINQIAPPSGNPLSIHDLEMTELVQNSEERERMLVKALRELVK